MLNPKWLLVINIIPVLVLFSFFYSEFGVINTLLDEESKTLWYNFGGTLLGLTTLLAGYIVFCLIQKKELSVFYAFIAIALYTIFLYTYSVHSSDIIPWSIPRWMITQDAILYPGTFIMPTLAHALFIIVIKLTRKDKSKKAWVNFLFALAVPLVTYLFAQIVMPLWRPVNHNFEQHVLIIGCVIGVIIFLFFLIRGFYILSIKKGKSNKKFYLIIKLIIGIALPVIGLAVNNKFENAFGNFNSFWFYILAVINGILIGLSHIKNKQNRLLLFISRSIMLSFTFYFFIVFLPFLPLSVIAVIALGAGFLMLTPLILFVIHVQELSKDFKFLIHFYKKNILITISIVGFLIIPSILAISYVRDRMVLHETLDYVYAPNYSKEYNINKASLEKTLEVIQFNKSRATGFLMNSQLPYLSSFFNWIVLDNLTLSDAKIKTIEKIFFGTESFNLRSENLRNKDVEISNITSNSTYNETEQTWTSWIDLEITNSNTVNFTSEYATTINLPNGCWISDYYLYVGDKKEMGILAEKKSAMWIFSQIRNVNRDPGLLHYLTGNKVSFRVFPFAKNEIRKTGIQFTHKEPINIEIDGYNCTLGEVKTAAIPQKSHANIVYVSSLEKETLKTVKRTPYYHFILDISKDKDSLKNSYIKTINSFVEKGDLNANNTKISFTNSFSKTQNFDATWENALKNQTFEGGFYLERAIKKILFNSYTTLSNEYPIIIVVSDNMRESVISKNFADFEIAFPECNLFYHLNTLGYLASHSLTNKPKEFINNDTKINSNNSVLVWPNTKLPLAYLPKNNSPSIVLKSSTIELKNDEQTLSKWDSGLLLQGKWLSDVFHPENSEKNWNAAVAQSFKSKIMTPLTSYIVVENEAQKAALLRKQKEVLEGKKSLDLNETTQRMSEPNVYILILLVTTFIYFKRKRLFKHAR